MIKIAIQSIVILLFWAIGEGISMLSNGVIPGSLMAMILLFIALCTSIIKEEWVSGVAKFLTGRMVLFFLPAAVGVMVSWEIISNNLIPMIITIVLSTLILIAVVGAIQQKLSKK